MPHCRANTHGRAIGAHGRACVTVQIFRFSLFHRFAHKISIVYPISILFSPTHSNHLNLSHSIEKSCFPSLIQLNPFSPKITYFPKTIKTTFSFKTQFSSQTSSYPKLMNQNINYTYVYSSPQDHQLTQNVKNHISLFLTHFLKNSTNNNNLNHNNTIIDTQGMNHHQQY